MTNRPGTITKSGVTQNCTAHFLTNTITPTGHWLFAVNIGEHLNFEEKNHPALPIVASSAVVLGSTSTLHVQSLDLEKKCEDIKEKTILTEEELFEKKLFSLLDKFIKTYFTSKTLGTGFTRTFTVTNTVPLSGSRTLSLMMTTIDPTQETVWGALNPVAWRIIIFNSQSQPASVTYQDNYVIATSQIDSGGIITPSVSKSCSTGDQWNITGTQTSPLWQFGSNSGGNPINATNTVKNALFDIGFYVNSFPAVVCEAVNYQSFAQFNPTPQMFFTVVSQIKQSQVLQSAVVSQTFQCDMAKFASSISATVGIASDGSTQVTFT